MELMLLVYLVNTIELVGTILFLIGVAWFGLKSYLQVREILSVQALRDYSVNPSKTVRAIDGKTNLKSDLGNAKAGTLVELSMYSDYGYVTGGGYTLDRFSRLAIEEALQPVLKPLSELPSVPKFSVPVLALVTALVGGLLPNKETTIYMAGAYIVQQVVTSDTAKEIGNLAVDATKAQLKAWATESPELANLMFQSGLSEIKQAATQADTDNL